VLLPAYEFEKRFAAEVAERWPGADPATTPFIVYCYGAGCTRSRFCATLAARAGWRNLWWFRDGMDGWRSAGFRVDRGPNSP
jgi:rhodanese-related sulfurtransferase